MKELDAFVRLYKEGLETPEEEGVEEGFLALLGTVPPDRRAAVLDDLSGFLSAERARLVKLKTLGLTAEKSTRRESWRPSLPASTSNSAMPEVRLVQRKRKGLGA